MSITLKRLMVLLMVLIMVVSSCKSKDEEVREEPVKREEQEPIVSDEGQDTAQDQVTLEKVEEKETVGFNLASLERKQVWFFGIDDDHVWDNPKPYFNPMGDETAYSDIYYEGSSYMELSYMSKDKNLVERYVYGEMFTLTVPFKENLTEPENIQFLSDVKIYIEELGGSIQGIEQDQTVFMMMDPEEIRWWGRVRSAYESIIIDLVKEREIKAGESIVIRPGIDENPFYFASYQDGEYYQRLHMEADGGYADMKVLTRSRYGDYFYESHIGAFIDEEVGNKYILGNLPLTESYSQYEVYWDDDAAPGEILLALEESLEVTSPDMGEDLGAIKVSAAYVSDVTVTPTNQATTYVYHPEADGESGRVDRTPDGDFMIFVPSGYWDVHLSLTETSVISEYSTVGVPVSAGEMTEISVPFPMAASMSEQDSEYNARGVEIGRIKEDEGTDQVSFHFTMLDDKTKAIPPTLDNTFVYESGQPVELLSVEHVDEPPKIVLLLDSSGSMKGQLDEVKEAAQDFVQGLPENSEVKVVDFDTDVKVLSGTTVDEAVTNISTLSVGGSTALYDSLREATDLLDSRGRATIVLFTDGENDLDGQVTITKEETLELLETSGIPVYAIGFGQGHDGKTLNDLSKVSQGLYFDAEDASALEEVFESINERIGSTYEATYKRPAASGFGDIPVVSFMVDTSGSMDEIDEGSGQRMNNVKNLLSPFIMDLPEETLVQLLGFVDRPYVIQSMTGDKRKLLQGVSSIESGGSTEVPTAVIGGWLSLKHVPSTKKVLIFITDEAMEPEDPLFIEAVDNLNKEGIEVLWVGLGLEEVEEAFAQAAELSNSDYVVTSDVDELTEAFNRVLDKVRSFPQNDVSQISIEIEKESDLGAREEFGDSTIVKLSEKKDNGEVQSIEPIKENNLGKITQYDPEMARKVLGFSESDKETIIIGRVTADKQREGNAASIHVNEVVYMRKLFGVDAPSGYRFVGLETSMANVLEDQEVMVYPDGSNHPSAFVAGGGSGVLVNMVPDYLIQDFRSHLFLTVNKDANYPASDATWLTHEPIVAPGKPEIYLKPDKTKEGMLVFVVPDEPIKQMSLHLFDIANGGVGVPIIGEMRVTEEQLTQMPDGIGQPLSETFSIHILDSRIIDGDFVEEENEDTVYRQVESLLTSNVHALLELEPTERIHMTVPTSDGDFWLNIHEATSLVPYGHYQKRQLAPGSNNKLLWLFEMPEILKDMASDLYFNLSGADVRMQINAGSIVDLKEEVLFEGFGDGFTVRVHDAFKTGQNSGFVGPDMLVVDVTIQDAEDGYSTQGIPELFYCKGVDQENDEQYEGYLSWISDDMLLGLNDDSIVYDGTSRRGFLVYQPGSYDDAISWQLKSSFFQDLVIDLDTDDLSVGLTVPKTNMTRDINFELALAEGVYEKIERYERTATIDPTVVSSSIESTQEERIVQTPMLTTYGDHIMGDVKNSGDVKDILKSLRYIPDEPFGELFHYSYSPEATLTQGFGTENDYANVALTLLKGLGLKSRETMIEINDDARKLLTDMAGIEVTRTNLPAVSYVENGEEHILVMPFVEDLEDLTGYCYYSRNQGYENSSRDGTLSVSFEVIPLNPDRIAQMDMMTGALAGETDAEPVAYLEEMAYRYIPESEMSLDPIDIGFVIDNKVIRTYMLRMNGVDWLEGTINLNDYEVKAVHIQADIGGQIYKHRTALHQDREMEHIFLTVGMNLPDLSTSASESLSEMKNQAHNVSDEVSDLSALRWYGRHLIHQFVEAQSTYENELANDLDLIVGRTKSKRMMVISMKAPMKDESGKRHGFEASVDLVDCFNDIHRGEDEAMHAFNILSGLNMTNLEMEILGDGGYGAFEIMNQVPDGTDMVIMEPYLASEDTDAMIEGGFPKHIIDYMLKLDKIILMPNHPAIIDGVERWAWFEIDPYTYKTIGVIDSFEKGAMVSNVIIDTVKNSGQYMVGGFVGITTSIWAVSAISLEESDYKKILEQAKKFALGMKDSFGIKAGPFGMSVGGKPSLSQNFGAFKYSFDGKGAFKQNIVGFTQGFEAGVNYYFDNAE